MSLTPGIKIGPYEVLSPLGAGGMGEVYRAHDSRLGREVAIKVLPESFARDADRMRRFEQEARAVAALNHPNVLAVFDVGVHEGAPYLVSELLEGETLRDRLKAGPVPQRKSLEYAVQTADGLAAAHEKGIVHRDLKPENLFLTNTGRIKILDFGLAKLEAPDDGALATATMTVGGAMHTAAGMVVGTAAYMSPEQVRGQIVDYRSDLFSFGAVLYEMLTGVRAFAGDSAIETMNSVLKQDPAEIDTVQLKVSPGLERIVRHCLEKNPADRFQSARDLGFALGALSGTNTSAALQSVQVASPRSWLPWAITAVAVVMAMALAFIYGGKTPPTERAEFAIPVDGEVSQLALSADGRMLAFVAPDDKSGIPTLFVQRVGSPGAKEMPGTDDASYPFWSPDNAYVAFFANGKLQKQALSGGAPQTIIPVTSARGGSWGSKNVIVYAPDASGWLFRVNADGTGAAPQTAGIIAKGEQSHRWPFFLPDGEHFLFWAGNFSNLVDDRGSGIFLSSISGKEKKLLVLAHSNFGYAAGNLLYSDEQRQLVAVTLDASNAKASGEPRVIANLVGFQPSTYWASFAVGGNGTVVYSASTEASRSTLTWFDRTGKELGQVGNAGVLSNPMLSPDGDHVSVDISDRKANNVDVWIESLRGGTNTRFTFDPAEEVDGVWSRDGKSIVFRSAAGIAAIYIKPTTGLELPKQLYSVEPGDEILPTSWTTDDKQILCMRIRSGGSTAVRATDLVLLPAEGGQATPFMVTQFAESNGQISSDGRWVTYASNESGEWEIYVTTFPKAEGKWQVSRGGGTEPRWRGDGKEIFYLGPQKTLMSVPVSSDATFSSGSPTAMFQIHGRAQISSTDLFTYDAAKDGSRFLVNRYAKPEHIPPLTVVLNATSSF